MKKIILVGMTLAVIFGFAACKKNSEKTDETKKNGEIYSIPITEVVDIGGGETAIFEVVTEENGEVATDTEGETMYIPYIPPVTEKGGYLVTDAAGSTIPSRPATTAGSNTNIDNDIGELDTPTNAGATAKPESTTKPGETTKPGATTKPESTTKPASTTKPSATKPSTTKPPVTEVVTTPIDGSLSSAKAQKLVEIMEGVENPFDEDLAAADFNAASKSIDTYIQNVESAVTTIKADKALYEFVGDQQLTLWLDKLYEARDNYQVFMTMVKQEEGKSEKNPLYYKAYTDFQKPYTASLEAYYFILFAAEDRI